MKTETKIEANPDPDDPFFVDIHVERVINGESPYEFMHDFKLDLRDAEKLESVIGSAISRSKERYKQHLDAEYEEMKVTEDKVLAKALDERRKRGTTMKTVDSWSIPVDTSVGAPIVFLKEDDEHD